MARRSTKERMSTAYHEAGHGVACVVQGHSVDKLTIVPGEDSLGECIHPSVYGYDFDDRQEKQEIARKIILVCYAGWPAEQIFNRDADESGSQSDYNNAFDLSREFGVHPRNMVQIGEDRHHAYLRKLRIAARKLVIRHWQAVEALAKELLKRQTLDGDDVDKTVKPFCL